MSDATRADADVAVPDPRPSLLRRQTFLIGLLVVLTAVLFESRVRSHDPRLRGAWVVTQGERPTANPLAEQDPGSHSGSKPVWVFRNDGTGGRSSVEAIRYGSSTDEGFTWWTRGGRLYIDQSGQSSAGGVIRMIETVVWKLLGSHSPRRPAQQFDFDVEDGKTIRIQTTVEESAAPLYLTWIMPPPARPVFPSFRPAAQSAPPAREQDTSTISDLYVQERLRGDSR